MYALLSPEAAEGATREFVLIPRRSLYPTPDQGQSYTMPVANEVVAYGRLLVGKMQWLSGNATSHEADHMYLLKSPTGGFCEITEASLFNCWEAVFAIGYCSNPAPSTKKSKVRETILQTGFEEVDYYHEMVQLLEYSGSPIWKNDAEPGDVIFFYGTSHVALCTGDENVLSLWCDPDSCMHLQATTISILIATITGDVGYYLDAVRRGLQDNQSTPNYQDVYLAISELADKNDEDPGSVRPEDVTGLLTQFKLIGEPGFCVQRRPNPFAAY